MTDITTVRLVISGSVQGVGYRQWLRRVASSLGVTGWVRNRRDGTVEAVAVGQRLILDRLVQRCRRGPPSATVDGVDVSPADGAETAVVAGFKVLPTE